MFNKEMCKIHKSTGFFIFEKRYFYKAFKKLSEAFENNFSLCYIDIYIIYLY